MYVRGSYISHIMQESISSSFSPVVHTHTHIHMSYVYTGKIEQTNIIKNVFTSTYIYTYIDRLIFKNGVHSL